MEKATTWLRQALPGFASLASLASLRFACFLRFLCFIWFDELLLAVRCEHTRRIAVWEEKGTVLGYS
jgi:hypothetical protein